MWNAILNMYTSLDITKRVCVLLKYVSYIIKYDESLDVSSRIDMKIHIEESLINIKSESYSYSSFYTRTSKHKP